MESTKKCTGCNRELPLSAFGKASHTPDGLAYRCKGCTNAAKREYMRRKRGFDEIVPNPALADFQPVDLINELRARGYSGTLQFTQTKTIKV